MNETARRDALPLWVIVLLILFFLLRVFDVADLPHGKAARSDQMISDAAMQNLIETDLLAKTAYAETLNQQGAVLHLNPKEVREALISADSFQKETQNSADAARHVILLRALLKQSDTPQNAAKDPAPLAPGPYNLPPLAAFTTALPHDVSPPDRAAFAAEGRLWQEFFQGGRLSPAQAAVIASEISSLPEIRWWRWPALSLLYRHQGNLAEANRMAHAARTHGTVPLVGVELFSLLRLALGVLGVILLVYLITRAFTKPSSHAEGKPRSNLWPTLPEWQPYSERRLGSGDLMAVFVVYLVARQVISLALGGFPGIGVRHLLRVPGIITPFLGTISRMPMMNRETLEVVLEALTYLLAAVPPIVYLWMLARRRGASLARELGWSTRNLGPNAAYGVLGYALATPLMFLVALLAPSLFRHAPAPSNPVIPEMAATSGFWTTALLILLASVAAPLVEELLFRGVFYNAAKLRLGPWPAIVLTGLVFGFLHPVGIVEMLAISVLGGVFAWMAETRKSLVPSITAHCLNNLISTLILLLALAG